jgi:hypothetical protein
MEGTNLQGEENRVTKKRKVVMTEKRLQQLANAREKLRQKRERVKLGQLEEKNDPVVAPDTGYAETADHVPKAELALEEAPLLASSEASNDANEKTIPVEPREAPVAEKKHNRGINLADATLGFFLGAGVVYLGGRTNIFKK